MRIMLSVSRSFIAPSHPTVTSCLNQLLLTANVGNFLDFLRIFWMLHPTPSSRNSATMGSSFSASPGQQTYGSSHQRGTQMRMSFCILPVDTGLPILATVLHPGSQISETHFSFSELKRVSSTLRHTSKMFGKQVQNYPPERRQPPILLYMSLY